MRLAGVIVRGMKLKGCDMRQYRLPYDLRTLGLSLLAIVALIIGMKIIGGWAFALLIPIAFMTLAGNRPEQLVYILLLSISTILMNGYFVPKDMIYAISERGLFVSLGFILMTQVAGRRNSRLLTPVLGLLPYIAYMLLVSFFGWCPVISLLKIFLFTTIFMAYYAIAVRSSAKELDIKKLRGMILAIASFFIIGSIFAQRFGWAYMTLEEMADAPTDGASLYKGLASHANALGGILAFYALFLLADMLFVIQRPDKLYSLNLLCALYLIARSGSRTSMGTFVLGASFAGYCFFKSRQVAGRWKNRIRSFAVLLVALGGLLILLSSSGRDKIKRFVVKYGKQDEAVVMTTENVIHSRQAKIEQGIDNWRKSPWVGNGFQVSEDMKGFKVSSLRSILTAPVEKSVWITAILEEGGVAGFIIFVLFLFIVIPTLVKRKAYIGGTMFFAFVCSNLGEFTFFSMSGGGGMQWGMVFVGFILDVQRLKIENRARAVPPIGPMMMSPR